jgi:hypothetical protein
MAGRQGHSINSDEEFIWSEPVGEVEREIVGALRKAQKKRDTRLALNKIATIALLFIGYVGVYICGSCYSVATPAISSGLGYDTQKVSQNTKTKSKEEIYFFFFFWQFFFGK